MCKFCFYLHIIKLNCMVYKCFDFICFKKRKNNKKERGEMLKENKPTYVRYNYTIVLELIFMLI